MKYSEFLERHGINRLNPEVDYWICAYLYGEPHANPGVHIRPTRVKPVEIGGSSVNAYLKSGRLSTREIYLYQGMYIFKTEDACRAGYDEIIQDALRDLDDYQVAALEKIANARTKLLNLKDENQKVGD